MDRNGIIKLITEIVDYAISETKAEMMEMVTEAENMQVKIKWAEISEPIHAEYKRQIKNGEIGNKEHLQKIDNQRKEISRLYREIERLKAGV